MEAGLETKLFDGWQVVVTFPEVLDCAEGAELLERGLILFC